MSWPWWLGDAERPQMRYWGGEASYSRYEAMPDPVGESVIAARQRASRRYGTIYVTTVLAVPKGVWCVSTRSDTRCLRAGRFPSAPAAGAAVDLAQGAGPMHAEGRRGTGRPA